MKRAKYGSEEESSEPGCGCAVALAVPVLLLGYILHTAAPEAFILIFWGGGWGAIIWAAKRVPRTPNPAPPPVPEGAETGNMQFNVVDDTTQPGHSKVVWTKRETGTSS